MTRSKARARSAASGDTLGAGSVVDGYRVQRVLATRRGIDTLAEATAPDGRRAALTVLAPEIAADKARRSEFLRLARLQASLRHPSLAPVLGAGYKGGRAYCATALVEGETLAEHLRRGPLEPARALAILGEVAAALELAGPKGLVHRDLRPAAVALVGGEHTHAILIDFGISWAPGRAFARAAGAAAIEYRSPEELRGEPPRLRSSVYSFACILVECLTGEPPHRHDRPLLTAHAHLVEPPPCVSQRRGDLPPELDAVIAEALSKDPRRRFRSPAALIEAAARAVGSDVRVPVEEDRRRQQAREKATAREQRRDRRRARRAATARVVWPLPRGSRRAAVWAAVALVASALSGFATGNASWSPEPRQARSGPAAPEGPSPATVRRAAYLQSVGDTIDQLAERRSKLRRSLRSATGHKGQAVAATALAAAYREARSELPAAPVAAGQRLDQGLGRAARAYRRLAAAAWRTDGRAWQVARVKAARSEIAAERALSALVTSEAR
jgi:serine/threonine protein kinase